MTAETISKFKKELNQVVDIAQKIDKLNDFAWDLGRKDTPQAKKLSQEALTLAKENNYKKGIAYALKTISVCEVWLSNHESALENATQAISIFQELNDKKGEAQANYILGQNFYYLADYDNALKYFNKSRVLHIEDNDIVGEANGLNGMGTVYYTIEESEKALECLQKSLKITEEKNETALRQRVLDGLGSTYTNLKKYIEAIECYSQCLETIEQLGGDAYTKAYALQGMGYCHYKLNEFKKAIKAYEECLELRQKIDFKHGIADVMGKIGQVYIAQNENDKAISHLKKTLELADEISSKENVYKTSKLLSEVHEKIGENEKALAYYKMYHLAQDDVRSEAATKRSKSIELLSEMEQVQKDKEVLEQKNSELESIQKDITLIAEMGKKIISSLSVENIVETVYESINEIMDAPSFGIGIYNEEDNVLVFPGYLEKGKKLSDSIYDLNDNNRLAVVCFNNEKEILINNFWEEHSQYVKEIKAPLAGEAITSVIYMPLKSKGKKIGVITAQSFKENSYTEYHLKILRSLSVYAAIALENANLYSTMEATVQKRTVEIQQSYENVRLLGKIGQQIISSLSLEDIFEKLQSNVNQLMDASIFSIRILKPEENIIEYKYTIENGQRLDSNIVSLDDKDNYSVWCVEKKKDIFINDHQKEYKKYTDKIVVVTGELPESLIFCPMIIGEKVIGCITAQTMKKNAYTKYHLDILRTLASYTAIALENANLYHNMEEEVIERTAEVVKQKEQIEKTFENTKLLSQMGKEITSMLSVKKIVGEAYDNINSLMDATVFGVGVYDKSINGIRFSGAMEKGKMLKDFSYGLDEDKIAISCYTNKEEILINNWEEEYIDYVSESYEAVAGAMPNSMIYLPLIANDEKIGVITVQSFEKEIYNDYHFNMLKSLAVYVAIALDNARLYESVEKTYENTKLINQIGRELSSSLSVQSVAEKVYENVNKLMDASIFGISVYNEKTREIEVKGAIENGKKLPDFSFSIDDTDKLGVWSYVNSAEVVINDLEKEYSKYIKENKGPTIGEQPNSIIYIPLISKGKTMAAISVQSMKKHAYSNYQVDILRSIALYAAVALENANLYETMEDEVKDRTKEVVAQKEEIERAYNNTRLLSEIGQQLTSTLDFEIIFSKLYESVNQLMDASCFGVRLYHKERNVIDYKYEIESNELLPSGEIPVNPDINITAWCVVHKKVVFINDIDLEHTNYVRKIQVVDGKKPYSLIVYPLIISEKVLGAITVQSFEKHAYKKYHVDIIRTLASYTAIALENANLYQNMEDQVLVRTEEVVKQKEIIEEKNKDITDSIHYAKRLQSAILPTDSDVKKLLPKSYVMFRPKDIVSGDFYWIETIGSKVFYAVVDCTGHGVPGAFMSILGHNGLNEAVAELGNVASPAKILDHLNKSIHNTLHKTVQMGSVRDGMDVAICSLDKDSKTLEFAGAFNPLWVLRGDEIIETKGDKRPIGSAEFQDYQFTNNEIQLEEGDTVCIFSDGYADQFGGPKGKKYKYGKFKDLLLSLNKEPVEKQLEKIDAEFFEWKGDYDQIDDVCIFTVKV